MLFPLFGRYTPNLQNGLASWAPLLHCLGSWHYSYTSWLLVLSLASPDTTLSLTSGSVTLHFLYSYKMLHTSGPLLQCPLPEIFPPLLAYSCHHSNLSLNVTLNVTFSGKLSTIVSGYEPC